MYPRNSPQLFNGLNLQTSGTLVNFSLTEDELNGGVQRAFFGLYPSLYVHQNQDLTAHLPHIPLITTLRYNAHKPPQQRSVYDRHAGLGSEG